MKTLVNKANPQIRITAPEIEICTGDCIGYYYVGSVGYCVKDRWTLVEEEPTEGIRGKKEEIPSNVDLEKEIEKAQEHYFALKDKGFSLDSMDVSVLARHFYELGRKVRKEE